MIVSGPQHLAIEVRTFVLIGNTFSRDPADAVEAGTRAGRTARSVHMRPRSLLPGVLGRGRERNPHPCARSLCARSTCPSIIAAGRLPSPDEEASPELWKTLSREVRVQIGDKGAQPLFAEPREPRNHAVFSSALNACNRLCHRFGHSPPFQGPLHVRNRMGGCSSASPSPALTQIRTGRPMSPRRPALLADRHSFVGLTRHRATRWPDRVGDHAPTTWLHEH